LNGVSLQKHARSLSSEARKTPDVAAAAAAASAEVLANSPSEGAVLDGAVSLKSLSYASKILNKQIEQAKSRQEILNIVNTRGSEFNYVNCSTALYRISIVSKNDKPSAEEMAPLLALLESKVGEFKQQATTNSLRALAKLGLTPSALVLSTLSSTVKALAGEFKPQEVSNTLWALAILKHEPPFELLERASAISHTFRDIELYQIGFAHKTGLSLGWQLQPSDELLARAHGVDASAFELNERIVGAKTWQEVLEIVKSVASHNDFSEVNCSTAIHRVAKYALMSTEKPTWKDTLPLFDLLDSKIDSFRSQEVSLTFWGLAKLRRRPPAPLLEKLMLAAKRSADEFNAQSVANTLNAMSELKLEPPIELIKRGAFIAPAFNRNERYQMDRAQQTHKKNFSSDGQSVHRKSNWKKKINSSASSSIDINGAQINNDDGADRKQGKQEVESNKRNA